MVTVPAYQWLWSEHDVVNHHRRRYTRRTLEAAAAPTPAGRPTRPPTSTASSSPRPSRHRGLLRLRRRGATATPAVSDLERTSPRLNRLLERPLNLEARLIGSGRRIPCGLSLMAVFR